MRLYDISASPLFGLLDRANSGTLDPFIATAKPVVAYGCTVVEINAKWSRKPCVGSATTARAMVRA